MINKNQLIVFVVSFLIVGFFVLWTPKASFSGSAIIGCCQFSPSECSTCFEGQLCLICPPEEFFEGVACNESTGRCVEPIPTLSQWGMIVMSGVLGMFAVIGLLAMRRRSGLTS